MKDMAQDIARIRERATYLRVTAEPRYALEDLQQCVKELCDLVERLNKSAMSRG